MRHRNRKSKVESTTNTGVSSQAGASTENETLAVSTPERRVHTAVTLMAVGAAA